MRIEKCLNRFPEKDLDIPLIISPGIITNGFSYSLASGNWSCQRNVHQGRAGVSQALNRLSFVSTLSHLRRISSPVNHSSKATRQRNLHSTQWGIICPVETPEGASVVLIKNFALSSYISVGTDPNWIGNVLSDFGMEFLQEIVPVQGSRKTKIFVDGCLVGVHSEPDYLMEQIRKCRRSHNLTSEMSLFNDRHNREIHIRTDAGRVSRPLMVVENGKLRFKKRYMSTLESFIEYKRSSQPWKILERNGIIEYVDPSEEEMAMIAMYPNELMNNEYCNTYTHC